MNATPHGYSIAYIMSAGIFLAGAVLTAALYRVGVPDEIRNGQAPIVG